MSKDNKVIVYPVRFSQKQWDKLLGLAEITSRSRAGVIRHLVDLASLQDHYIILSDSNDEAN